MFTGCELLGGFYPVERDAIGSFAWTGPSFRIRLRRSAHFAHLKLCYYGAWGTLAIRSSHGSDQQVPIHRGWHDCVLPLYAAQAGVELELYVAPLVPVAGDTRHLGVMIREIELFDDPSRYERFVCTGANLRQNHWELHTGQTVLASSPPQLRISMDVRCNIPETSQACVYCPWDWAKLAERGSPPFTLDMLDQLGTLYRSSLEIVDCSIGEPTMHREFGAIIARIDGDGKQLSLTTNGQLLTPHRRRELWGRNVLLYPSLDAATAEGYARYRNDRFDDLVSNLTALCREKKAHRNLPRVHLAFLVMHSNVVELRQFFDLACRIGVDEVKLRTLNLDEDLAPVQLNNGYRFDYAQELLTVRELDALAPLARTWARERGLPLYIDWEQFPRNVQSPGGPLCSEPWKTLYVLRRGIMPCCYATRPLATWDQQRGRSLDQFLRDVLNSAAFQDIRMHLAAGELSEYCRSTPSCPILKNMQQQGHIATSGHNLFQLRALDGRVLTSPSVDCSPPKEGFLRDTCHGVQQEGNGDQTA